MKFIAAPIVFPALFCVTGELWAVGLDLEVILATAISRSIDESEFELQRKGYAAALAGPRVLAAIHRQPHGAIGVCFIEFSGAIAAALRAAPRSFMGRTSVSAAIDFAAAPWHGARQAVDVSGDGTSNSGRPITEAREIDRAARGATRPMAVGQ